MNWGINTLIPLLAVLANSVLLVIVIRARPSTHPRRAFRAYLFAMLLWSLGSFITHSGFWNTISSFRLIASASIAAPITIFYFVQTFLDRSPKWAVLAYVFGFIGVLVALFTPLVAPSASLQDGILTYEIGPLVPLVAAPGYGLFIYSLIQLVRYYQKINDPIERNRLRYLIIGIGLVIATTVFNFTPLGRYPIDIAANGVNAVLIAYAIFRHELLDINIFIRKSLSYATLILALALSYLVPVLLFEVAASRMSTGLTTSGVLLAFGFALLIAGIIHSIYGRFRDRIDRFYFRERYDAYQMVQELGNQITGTLDLDKIVSILLDRIMETLHPKAVGLLLRNPMTGDLILRASRGIKGNVPRFRLRRNHPICRWLSHKERVLTARALDIQPHFSGMWQEERELLDLLRPDLFVSLRAKGDLIGILFVGSKQSEEPYSLEDTSLFSTLANQVAVALENARLFQETNSRLAEQIAIFEVGESLARAFNLDDILQLVVNHACSANAASSSAVIHLVDHEMKRLIPRAVCRTDGEPAYAVGFGLDQGIIGRALQKRQQVYLPDAREAPDFVDTGEDFRSLVVIPLIVEDVTEGALSVTSPVANAFDVDALRQLASLGNQAAIAVRKAQITERLRSSLAELEERSKELESSLIQLQSAQKQLVQAGKLASLGTLSAGIAHELNNPLAGIKLFAQNLLRYQASGKLTPEKLGESLKKIDTLVDKAADIIEHLRAFSRQSSGKLEPLVVNQPVEDALSMLSEQLRLRNIRLNVDLKAELPPVLGDANQLEQVIINLIANARDAVEQSEEKEICLRTFDCDGYVFVEVVDSGCGINPDDLDKIFDPFFTTKAVGEGTGLGLSISHGIVEYHGGDIEVESVMNEGTTFRIKLPASKG